ncbi:flagellar biosynthesis protein FlhF [Priestia aryabhattai]|uniref:flagellar biosynthesis protein FlhF n=1 Tax=Priestia aryabhattai TaxID=412384 RepID=UPI00399F31FB
MKVKKYVVASMPQAMKAIRSDLGEEAVILHSKQFRTGGFFGLFTKTKMEVLAAVDSVEKLNVKKKSAPAEPGMEDNTSFMKQQLSELNALVSQMSQMQKVSSSSYPQAVENVLAYLRLQEIDEAILENVETPMLEYYYLHRPNSNQLMKWTQSWFVNQFKASEWSGSFKKYVSVVGPTGVGKTTTLAKLAAKCVLEHNQKIAFITTDTYRISAIEQLKTYASILNAPLTICYNGADFKKALVETEAYDVIFIDTAGRNFLEEQYVSDLKKIITFKENLQTFLVLALTSKVSDMKAVYERFASLPVDQLIFTKRDETTQKGSLLNMLYHYGQRAAFTTYGQDVPEDISPFKIEVFIDDVFGDWKDE